MKSIITISIAILFAANLLAQNTFNQTKLPATQEMVMQVKQFGQFIERFNYAKNFKSQEIDSAFRSQYPRKNYITLLFNLADPRFDSTKLTYSPEYVGRAERFIDNVVNNNLLMDRYCSNVVAEALCNVEYKKVKKQLTMMMRKRIYPNTASEWYIDDVVAPWLALEPCRDKQSITIPPTSNETNFIRMYDLLLDKQHVTQIMDTSYVYDTRSVFLFLLQQNSLTMLNTQHIKYRIYQIDGWFFTVEYFNRNSLNSGWLISDLEKLK